VKLFVVLWISFLSLEGIGCNFASSTSSSRGVTPEQIFQPSIDWQAVFGTWEVIPEGHPLSENAGRTTRRDTSTLLTLRKDGTCRLFDPDHPSGTDGIWTFENHEIYIKLHSGKERNYYIYGVKGDFMVTRSPVNGGKDQLWSRVR